jgi:hypothetical protein
VARIDRPVLIDAKGPIRGYVWATWYASVHGEVVDLQGLFLIDAKRVDRGAEELAAQGLAARLLQNLPVDAALPRSRQVRRDTRSIRVVDTNHLQSVWIIEHIV